MTIPAKNRIESLDLLKGVVIVIMALDHVRDYFHYDSYLFDPTDPVVTNIPLFLTRFITNFCAPAFSFLAGVSAFMVGKRKSGNELSVFLLKRGLWLVFIEAVIMNFGWMFDIHYTMIAFQVIWSLGISMIVLAGIIHLRRPYILILSCVLIFAHNLLDTIHVDGNIFWSFVHDPQTYPVGDHRIRFGYPLIPWVAVMSLGYWFGQFYDRSVDPSSRRRTFNIIGLSALALFIVLRATNLYGNPLPWTDYGNLTQNIFSFFKLAKYPPSLLFLLVTLGPTLLFLANSENLKGRFTDFFSTFGRVPFFFYIFHIYLIHVLALIAAEFTGWGWQAMILPALPFRVEALKGFGFNLLVVYCVWISVIALLFPLCLMFDRYKQNHKDQWWLSYL